MKDETCRLLQGLDFWSTETRLCQKFRTSETGPKRFQKWTRYISRLLRSQENNLLILDLQNYQINSGIGFQSLPETGQFRFVRLTRKKSQFCMGVLQVQLQDIQILEN